MNTHGRQRGMSLIEMIAVLVLIALATSVVAFSIGNSLGSAKIRAASRDLAGALRWTRGQAIVQREEQALEIDVEQRSYRYAGREPVLLPEDMEMRLLTAESELTGDTSGLIRFFPDGSSTGGRVSLVRGEREWQVHVVWLTGEIGLQETR